MYYTDDELRKQGEFLSGKVVVTEQEMANSGKDVREDLYKRHISADPVAVRLPYAIAIKQVEMMGWKRFEINKPPKFRGVDEVTLTGKMASS